MEGRSDMKRAWQGAVPIALGLAFACEVVVLGWSPYDRAAWWLENLVPIPVAIALVSLMSWCSIFLFLALHEIGSHYTYSLVPWMEWSRDLLGWAPEWSRNHYDRFLHLSFGLLITHPVEELFARRMPSRPVLRRLMTLCTIVTLSSVYELAEWAAALLFDPELGIGFVGAQGDIWDAQKDMALALGGSCISIGLSWLADRCPVPLYEI
jgi:putative membrane protein